jgi:hypothetical protein
MVKLTITLCKGWVRLLLGISAVLLHCTAI